MALQTYSPTNLTLGPMSLMAPAINGDWSFIGGTWTPTRSAAGIYYMRKTAGAATTFAILNLTQFLQRYMSILSANVALGSELQELLLTSVDLIYAIGTATLTALTPVVRETTYVTGQTPTVDSGLTNAAPVKTFQ